MQSSMFQSLISPTETEYDIYIHSVGFQIIGMSIRPIFDKFKDARGKISELAELEEVGSNLNSSLKGESYFNMSFR